MNYYIDPANLTCIDAPTCSTNVSYHKLSERIFKKNLEKELANCINLIHLLHHDWVLKYKFLNRNTDPISWYLKLHEPRFKIWIRFL